MPSRLNLGSGKLLSFRPRLQRRDRIRLHGFPLTHIHLTYTTLNNICQLNFLFLKLFFQKA